MRQQRPKRVGLRQQGRQRARWDSTKDGSRIPSSSRIASVGVSVCVGVCVGTRVALRGGGDTVRTGVCQRALPRDGMRPVRRHSPPKRKAWVRV